MGKALKNDQLRQKLGEIILCTNNVVYCFVNDNLTAKVRCFFFKLDPIQKADAKSLFSILDSNFSDHGSLYYEHLVGFGSHDANVMIGIEILWCHG